MNTQRYIGSLLSGLFVCGVFLAPPVSAETRGCPTSPAQTQEAQQTLISSLQTVKERAPAPLPRVHTEGTLPHQGIYDISVVAKKDLPLMQNAALVWRITKDDTWLKFAHRYLMAWVKTYQPSFNPIDETGFDSLIETYAIIQTTMPEEERRQVNQYLQDWAYGYLQTIQHHADHRGIWTNNWQSHRIKLISLIAVTLDNPNLLASARELFEAQVGANIAPTGETLDFKERDALHYVVYDLQPLVQAALAARAKGEDWYHWRTPDSASLAAAITWLTPYVSGTETHEEFVHSQVRFDAIREQAGLKGFSGLFDPHVATALYWLLAELDPSLRPLATQLGKPPFVVAFCGA